MKNLILFLSLLILGSCISRNNNNSLNINECDTSSIDTKKANITPLVVKLYRTKNKDMSISSFDSLITYKRIVHKYQSDNDVFETRTLLVVDTIKNAMRTENTESMNSSVVIDEYRVVELDDKIKLIYSVFAGTRAFTSQSEFIIYDYRNDSLIIDSISVSNFLIKSTDFLTINTPDSIRKEIGNESCYFFHIVYNDKGIAECWYSCDYFFDKYKKWFAGNTICYSIVNNKIERSKPYFRD